MVQVGFQYLELAPWFALPPAGMIFLAVLGCGVDRDYPLHRCFLWGKQTELSVPMQFIDDAWEVLSPGGQLFLVANRTLPYETPIRRRFGNVLMVHDGRRFKVLTANK